jgi:hypothetical protein
MVNLSAPNPLLSITFKGLRNIKMSSTPIQFETEEKKIVGGEFETAHAPCNEICWSRLHRER